MESQLQQSTTLDELRSAPLMQENEQLRQKITALEDDIIALEVRRLAEIQQLRENADHLETELSCAQQLNAVLDSNLAGSKELKECNVLSGSRIPGAEQQLESEPNMAPQPIAQLESRVAASHQQPDSRLSVAECVSIDYTRLSMENIGLLREKLEATVIACQRALENIETTGITDTNHESQGSQIDSLNLESLLRDVQHINLDGRVTDGRKDVQHISVEGAVTDRSMDRMDRQPFTLREQYRELEIRNDQLSRENLRLQQQLHSTEEMLKKSEDQAFNIHQQLLHLQQQQQRSSAAAAAAGGVLEDSEHVEMLKAQLQLFKEDFECERSDRERAQANLADVQHRLAIANRQLDLYSRQLASTTSGASATRHRATDFSLPAQQTIHPVTTGSIAPTRAGQNNLNSVLVGRGGFESAPDSPYGQNSERVLRNGLETSDPMSTRQNDLSRTFIGQGDNRPNRSVNHGSFDQSDFHDIVPDGEEFDSHFNYPHDNTSTAFDPTLVREPSGKAALGAERLATTNSSGEQHEESSRMTWLDRSLSLREPFHSSSGVGESNSYHSLQERLGEASGGLPGSWAGSSVDGGFNDVTRSDADGGCSSGEEMLYCPRCLKAFSLDNHPELLEHIENCRN